MEGGRVRRPLGRAPMGANEEQQYPVLYLPKFHEGGIWYFKEEEGYM